MLRAYLELLRPANVTTAAADVLAGYAAAGLGNGKALPWLILASTCLYGGGVVLNDFFDRNLDAVERPERPIPSGRVRPSAAAIFGVALLATGILAATRATYAAALIACAIALSVLLYDSWGKRHPRFGSLNMGFCRGLNFLLGVAAVPAALGGRWPLALLSVTYICAITALARGEVHGGKRETALFSLASLLVVIGVLLVISYRSPAGLVLTCLLAARVLPPFWRAYNDPTPALIRNAVKTGVLSLVVMDAVIGAIYAGVLYSAIILSTALLAGSLARVFSVT
jgi:4-hydroxybenzoate polyprenyltransferase